MGNQFDLSLGCLLMSSWANMVLFTLELKEIAKYFGRYKNDAAFNKIMVLIALTGDTLTVVACLSSTYLYMVTHWGEQAYLISQPWGIAGYVTGTGITGAAVQIFLTRMLFRLTKQWFWLPIIGLFIAVGVAGAGATAGTLILDSSIAARPGLVKWVTVWLSGCIAADFFITAILVRTFRNLQSEIGRGDTRDLLSRLSIAAVRNGSITTAVTIVTIVLFKLQPETNTALMLEITIGRVYSLCMLSNLNNRVWRTDTKHRIIESTKAPTHGYGGETAAGAGTVVRIQKDVQYTVTRDDGIPLDALPFGSSRKQQTDAERGGEYEKNDHKGASFVEF
ncbi:hypothetical protein B0H15DRAFT_872079 [Mycena belliarum]|uniref:DUF6534 domain-containing protein n=1 Tax=Mycena belliarum TaxID=1033014 RepID=A0AAD6TQJ1_9AGAR|nr:hypothetical protein B0H15DRAFT_872079 [Mycena belliae]